MHPTTYRLPGRNTAPKPPSTYDRFLHSIPSPSSSKYAVQSWLYTWFQHNYLFLDPFATRDVQRFLSHITLDGNAIRSLNEISLKRYFSAGSRGLNLKESIEGLVADIQIAKGVEIENIVREKEEVWRKNVNRERARWMVISGLGMGATLAMQMWL